MAHLSTVLILHPPEIVYFKFIFTIGKIMPNQISSRASLLKLIIGSFMLIIFQTKTAWSHVDDHSNSNLSEEAANSEMPTGHHAMTHPFMTHMGMPDGPGEIDVRVTGIQRAGQMGSASDSAVHVEAGLTNRIGIHLRNDSINGAAVGAPGAEMEDHGTELMLMYALVKDKEDTMGISIFGETSVPTVQGTGPSVRGAFGAGGRYQFGTRALLYGDVHVDPTESKIETEYECSAQIRLVNRAYVLIENSGNFGGNGTAKNYLLPAIKLGIGKTPATIGVGIQFPTTNSRDYNRQVLFQFDWSA